ncbi:MAG: hypothetical protein A2075_22150 [Geobacteraceae bacterium GWC2_58_44]|nr:MAG: hypothetical protein A2075_22150 [Geobacteraceae bacterium GWC2_58_44]
MIKTNNIRALTQSIRSEERAKARAEIYKELIEKQAKLEMMGLSQPLPASIMTDMRADLSKAVKGAMVAQKERIRLGVKAELEEMAGLEGCHLPSLLAEALMDYVKIDDAGNVVVIDVASQLPVKDTKTGEPIPVHALILQARQNPSYQPLFSTSGSIPSAPSIKNPWIKGEVNLTQQAQIISENPAMADRLMAAAKG